MELWLHLRRSSLRNIHRIVLTLYQQLEDSHNRTLFNSTIVIKICACDFVGPFLMLRWCLTETTIVQFFLQKTAVQYNILRNKIKLKRSSEKSFYNIKSFPFLISKIDLIFFLTLSLFNPISCHVTQTSTHIRKLNKNSLIQIYIHRSSPTSPLYCHKFQITK